MTDMSRQVITTELFRKTFRRRVTGRYRSKWKDEIKIGSQENGI